MEQEEWRDVAGHEGYYQVSSFGNVRSLDHVDRFGHHYQGRILRLKKLSNGYIRVHLSVDGKSKWYSVHRLVAAAFCTKPDGMDIVNHLDNNPSNNHFSNLEWTDYVGNMQHATRQGRLHYNPENLRKAIESRKKPVIAIAPDGKRYAFESGAEASRVLGVTRGHIAACCRKAYGYKTLHGYQFEYAEAN